LAAVESWWAGKLAETEPTLDQNGVTALWWSYALAGDGAVQNEAELDQTIKIICTTPYGSDVHRPTFSSGIWNYIDWPIPQATPQVVRESTQAIQRWEPRVELVNVAVEPYTAGIESLAVTAQWTIQGFSSQTSFAI
jgi:phage baseplate assembly protein W